MARKRPEESGSGDVGIGGVLRGLGSFLDLLSDLGSRADQAGGEFKRGGEAGDDKNFKAVYGFSVRVGGGGKPVVEPFGNVKTGHHGTVVDETREPMVDVFDEGDHLVVVAELPGITADDIRFEVRDDVLTLSGLRADRKYRKEILLPAPVNAQAGTSSYRNGVFELRLPKAG